MPKCTIHRYFRGSKSEHEFHFNAHVTITGNENHFALAHRDAELLMRGMREADQITNWGDDTPPRYWLHSVSLD